MALFDNNNGTTVNIPVVIFLALLSFMIYAGIAQSQIWEIQRKVDQKVGIQEFDQFKEGIYQRMDIQIMIAMGNKGQLREYKSRVTDKQLKRLIEEHINSDYSQNPGKTTNRGNE